MAQALIGPITQAQWRGRRDGKANILPEESGKEYMTGFWEGLHEFSSDPMTLWRRVNATTDECDRVGCNHH